MYASGGALYAGGASSISVEDSTFSKNIAGGEGGAIKVSNATTLAIRRTQFAWNQGRTGLGGGAIRAIRDLGAQGSVLLENVYALDNVATYGSFLSATDIPVQIDRSLIVGKQTGSAFNLNNASTPGIGLAMSNTGIFVEGAALSFTSGLHSLLYSTVASSIANSAIAGSNTPSVTASGLLLDGNCTGSTSFTNSSWSNAATSFCGTAFQVAARAEILGDFDGEMALPRGIAVDGAGFCTFAGDVLGNPRPVDGDGDGVAKCDIGAYELQYVQLPDILFRDSFE